MKNIHLVGLFLLLCHTYVYAQSMEKLSLNDAITIALLNNPAILKAQKEIAASKGRALRAEAFPNLELGVQFDGTPTNFDITESDQINIGITQSFEFPGKRETRGNIARVETQITEENLTRIQELTGAEVKRAYYQAVLNQKLVSNIEVIIDLLRQFQEIATIRYQNRSVPFLEVLRAKIELAKANNQHAEIQRALQNNVSNLNNVLGRPGTTPIILSDDLEYTPFEKTLEETIAELLPKRSSLRIADKSLLRSEFAVSLAKKSFLPDFSLGLFHQSVKGQPPFNDNEFTGTSVNSWGIDLSLSIPLWFSSGPQGEVDEADANIQVARIQREAIERTVRTSIQIAFHTVKTAEAQVNVFKESLLQDIEDELQSGITLYRNNQIDALNLSEIYKTYTETKAEYYRALHTFNLALTDLEVAGEEFINP